MATFELTMRLRLFLCILLLPSLLCAQVVRKGVADLREFDFENNPYAILDGSWDFYPSNLISPSQQNLPEASSIDVPTRWDESGWLTMGYGSYQVTVIRSPSTSLTLRVPDIFSAYKLYVNQELVTQVGTPGVDKESSIPGRKVKMIPLTQFKSDTLNLTFHVSNFTHNKAGIGHSIWIGDYEKMARLKTREDAADFFLAGGLIIGAFFFFGLYIFGRKELMALHFGLFCIVYAYRIVGWGNYIVHDVVDMPYRLGVFLEFATLYLSGFFFALYIKNLYPKDTPKLLIKT